MYRKDFQDLSETDFESVAGAEAGVVDDAVESLEVDFSDAVWACEA